MADSSDPGAMAPFDAIPEPPPAEAAGGAGHGAESAAQPRRFAFKLSSPGTLLALVLALGFGQSLALLVFFGGRGDDLSESHGTNTSAADPTSHDSEHEAAPATDPHAAEPHGTDSHAAEPHSSDPHEAPADHASVVPEHDHPAEPTPAPEQKSVSTRVPDVLDTARDMLDRGDVSGARRIATAYLLRVDGMNAAARERASAAYAILGDAMRLDYELSLRLRGDDP
ncbi:MAG: hypothetical protein IPH13_07280 [Planctomycetes bacterium]|nr:hypothetical protein [Planctomycetota bacterium]